MKQKWLVVILVLVLIWIPNQLVLANGVQLFATKKRLVTEAEVQQLAKFEPVNGIYFGAFIEGERRNLEGNHFQRFNELTKKNHSIYYTYLRYGRPFPETWANQAKATGTPTIHVAFEPHVLTEVLDDEYLRGFARKAKELDLPIFLRFGAEMNGPWVSWHGNPEMYKEKFRLVAQVMKEEAPNVAMVLGPSSSPISSIESYYPGDEWVDWVGISFYNTNYSNANLSFPNHQRNPLLGLDFVYNKYAASKPIMIAEYGSSHMCACNMEDDTLFAINRLKIFYEAIRLQYPRIKAVNYFSLNAMRDARPERRISNYSLIENPRMLEQYSRLIDHPYFLNQLETEQKEAYQQIDIYTRAIKPPFEFSVLANTGNRYASYSEWLWNQEQKLTFAFAPYRWNVTEQEMTKVKNTLEFSVFDQHQQLIQTQKVTVYKSVSDVPYLLLFLDEGVLIRSDQIGINERLPLKIGSQYYLPLRQVAEFMDIRVKWNAKKKKIRLSTPEKKLSLRLKDVQTIDGISYVPLRFVSTHFGAKVTWNPTEKFIVIERPNQQVSR